MIAAGVERRMLTNIPWTLAFVALLIAGLGAYNLVSAGRFSGNALWLSQVIYIGVGLAAAGVVMVLDTRLVERLAIVAYAGNIFLLLLLKIVGHKAKGAESWLVLGPLRMQPAEFMKLGMVLMLAKFFQDDYKPEAPSYGLIRLVAPGVLALVPIGLVYAQPDLGTALMMTFTALTIIVFARVRWTVVLTFAFVCLLGGFILWNDYVRVQPEPRHTYIREKLKPHQNNRILSWLDPQSDLRGANYHSMQSKIAVGSGGFTGKGWMKGTQTELRYLPEQHTDFIFSVWAEEHGLWACTLLIILYGVLLIGSLGVAYNAKTRFGAFVSVGVAAMIFWQVFENIGMVTGLLPVTGITLPLMSYGGSSMVSVMIGLGLLANIAMRRHIF